jgi:hypothetical protein
MRLEEVCGAGVIRSALCGGPAERGICAQAIVKEPEALSHHVPVWPYLSESGDGLVE